MRARFCKGADKRQLKTVLFKKGTMKNNNFCNLNNAVFQ